MKGPAQIFRLDQARDFSRRGGFKFTAVLAQLRRDVIEIERAIEFFFVTDGRDVALRRPVDPAIRPYDRSEPIFVHRPTALKGAAAHDDVMLLTPSKII